MHFNIPRDVSLIIDRLRSNGYEAYAVGGCVRDSLLGRIPNDWDITTSALPLQVKELFKRTVDTGLKHGTVTILMNGTGYEVTTYRIDGEYNDCRHPDSVTFTSKLSEDLRRRDFTINAFVYNEEEGVIDLFNGLDDLKKGIIRCVGVPIERFTEDALRILRAVRFAAQLTFKIDAATAKAAGTLAPNLAKVSAERIHVELEKLLLSPNPDYIIKLKELDLAPYIFPELSECDDVKLHALCSALRFSSVSKYVRWSLLVCTFSHTPAEAAQMAVNIMRRLKSDNYTTDYIIKFASLMDYNLANPSDYELRRLLNFLGEKDFRLYINFREALCHINGSSAGSPHFETETPAVADCVQQAKTVTTAHSDGVQQAKTATTAHSDCVQQAETATTAHSDCVQQAETATTAHSDGVHHLESITARLSEIVERNDCIEAKQLKINGRILIANGFAQGKNLGYIIETLLDRVLADQSLNETDTLLALAAEISPLK